MVYEWMEGDFFLLKRVELEQQDGQRITGTEVIEHERPFGAKPGEGIRPHSCSNMGDTLDYVYELEGDTLRSGPGRGITRPTSRARSAPMTTPSPGPGTIREGAVTRLSRPGASNPTQPGGIPRLDLTLESSTVHGTCRLSSDHGEGERS